MTCSGKTSRNLIQQCGVVESCILLGFLDPGCLAVGFLILYWVNLGLWRLRTHKLNVTCQFTIATMH
ncbi:hypothetical protein SLE2022_298010 [Rubroshorea leprosula]